MNTNYSKVFELLNQGAEKERNKKAEKAVHDNLYNKGFRDGLAVLDKIRDEIKKLQKMCDKNDLNLMAQYNAFGMVLDILDKYKADMREVSVKIVNRGKCMLCGKELTEGLFFCKECEAKAETEK